MQEFWPACQLKWKELVDYMSDLNPSFMEENTSKFRYLENSRRSTICVTLKKDQRLPKIKKKNKERRNNKERKILH